MASPGGRKRQKQDSDPDRGLSSHDGAVSSGSRGAPSSGTGSGAASGGVPPRGASKGPVRQELTSVRFAAVARRLSETARQLGVQAPGFRSPPKAAGIRRSIRRETDGSATVSVALRGRPGIAVVGDMIDGIVSASGLVGVEAGAVRDDLWSAVAGLLDDEIEARGPLPTRLAA